MLTLNDAELHDLTGYKSGRAQRRWLVEQLRIDPPMGPNGRPKITRELVNSAMLLKRVGYDKPPAANDDGQGEVRPNWTRSR